MHSVGPSAYSPRQIEAWASFAGSQELIRGLREGHTLVAEDQQTIVAFGQLNPVDHIHLLYTMSSYCRRGLGRKIVRQLEEIARRQDVSSVTTNASVISMPMFSSLGYEIKEKELSTSGGIQFERYQMQHRLA